jgi:hypothetical protein
MKKAKSPASTARKPAARKPAARKNVATPRPAKNILAAGIKALSDVHEEAIARQSRVFESILGLSTKAEQQPDAPNPLTAALDPFGFRKFEDVFDQRVARSLEHLGVPSGEAFTDLTAEVERLRVRIAQLVAQLDARDKKR